MSHGFPLNTVILISEGEKDKCDTEEDYCQEVKGMEAAWAEKEGDISDVEWGGNSVRYDIEIFYGV